jgi:hypothetical protein
MLLTWSLLCYHNEKDDYAGKIIAILFLYTPIDNSWLGAKLVYFFQMSLNKNFFESGNFVLSG